MLVVVVWGGALVWLAWRQGGQSDQARIAEQASLRLAPGDAWFRVMSGDLQIGYAGITLDTLAGGRYRIQEQVALDLPMDSALTRAIRSTDYTLGTTLAVESFGSRLSGLGRQTGYSGDAVGTGWRLRAERAAGVEANGVLQLVQSGRSQPLAAIPLRALPLRLALVGALATGDRRVLPIAAGWPPTAWSAEILPDGPGTVIFADSSESVAGDSLWRAVRRDTVAVQALLIDSPEGPLRFEVDGRGTLVGVEYALGVRWVREDFDIARFNYRAVLDSTAPLIRRALPVLMPEMRSAAAEAGVAMTSYQLTRRDGAPIRPGLLALLADGRQQLVQGRMVIRAAGSIGRRDQRDRLADAMTQTDDSAVVALADAIGEIDDTNGIEMVARAIRRQVRLVDAVGAAEDAAGAVRERQARPEGLARLLAAVLRRNGYQARLAIGVRPDGDTLRTHAWVELTRGSWGTWRAVDPLSGQPLDTRWLRIALAGSTAPGDLLPLVADVRFSPVNAPVDEGEVP